MATSGSYNYNVTANTIIQEALELIGVKAVGETLASADTDSCLRTLNMMIKHWQAEGIALWKNREAALFLSYEGYSFNIGSTGDHCSLAWIKNEIATAASTGDGTITVDDDDGMSDGDNIGIELDDGTLQWTTINGAPVANVITLTAVLTDDVAVDNHVYTYTTKIPRPLEIIEARLHRADDTDLKLNIISRDEYMSLPTKTTNGVPTQIYFDPQLTNVNTKIWPACSDVQEYIKATFRIPIEDFDSLTNDADFGQEWLLPITWNLGVLVAPKYGAMLSPTFIPMATMLKQNVSLFDREQASVFIIPKI